MAVPPDSIVEALRERYTLERELGQGGMATVYLAWDRKHDRPPARFRRSRRQGDPP